MPSTIWRSERSSCTAPFSAITTRDARDARVVSNQRPPDAKQLRHAHQSRQSPTSSLPVATNRRSSEKRSERCPRVQNDQNRERNVEHSGIHSHLDLVVERPS